MNGFDRRSTTRRERRISHGRTCGEHVFVCKVKPTVPPAAPRWTVAAGLLGVGNDRTGTRKRLNKERRSASETNSERLGDVTHRGATLNPNKNVTNINLQCNSQFFLQLFHNVLWFRFNEISFLFIYD